MGGVRNLTWALVPVFADNLRPGLDNLSDCGRLHFVGFLTIEEVNMPKKGTSYATIKSLYGELEAARRVYEEEGELPWNRRSDGGQAYVLFLELLDIADWLGGASPPVDEEQDDGEDSVDSAEGEDDVPHRGAGQSDVPSNRNVAGREQAGVHPAAGLPSPVANDELLQQPLPGVVGGAAPGLIVTGTKRKVGFRGSA